MSLIPKPYRLNTQRLRPLAVICAWLVPNPAHVKKYVDIYLELGFDAIIVKTEPLDAVLPARSRITINANEVIRFLQNNDGYTVIVGHTLSAGSYVWCSTLFELYRNKSKYEAVLSRLKAQVLDSIADITNISYGVSRSVFPHNMVLQKSLKWTLDAHVKWSPSAPDYIERSHFFSNVLEPPSTLFFNSSNDPFETKSSNFNIYNAWKARDPKGIKVRH